MYSRPKCHHGRKLLGHNANSMYVCIQCLVKLVLYTHLLANFVYLRAIFLIYNRDNANFFSLLLKNSKRFNGKNKLIVDRKKHIGQDKHISLLLINSTIRIILIMPNMFFLLTISLFLPLKYFEF